MTTKRLRRRHLNPSHLLMMVGALLAILIICIALCLWIAKSVHSDPYSEFKKYHSAQKYAGKPKSYSMDKDKVFKQFYYPQFENTDFNTILEKQIRQFQKETKDEGIYTLDYKSGELWNQYDQVQFTLNHYNTDKKLIKTKVKSLCFDRKNKQLVKLENILRSDYLSALTAITHEKKITDIDWQEFQLTQAGITFYQKGKEVFTFPYAGNERFMKLQNEHVKGLAPDDLPKRPAKKKIDPDKPMIALTFDDGPNPLSTPRILDTLKKYDATGTFFMLGSRAIQYPNLIQRMVSEGHELGNHSNTHANLPKLTDRQIKDEFYVTQDAIYAASGEEATVFRPPYGASNEHISQMLNRRNILWTIDSLDWKSRNVEAIKKEVLPFVKDGSIILMHGIYGTSADALAQLMPILAKQGYQFVSVSDLLQYRPNSQK